MKVRLLEDVDLGLARLSKKGAVVDIDNDTAAKLIAAGDAVEEKAGVEIKTVAKSKNVKPASTDTKEG